MTLQAGTSSCRSRMSRKYWAFQFIRASRLSGWPSCPVSERGRRRLARATSRQALLGVSLLLTSPVSPAIRNLPNPTIASHGRHFPSVRGWSAPTVRCAGSRSRTSTGRRCRLAQPNEDDRADLSGSKNQQRLLVREGAPRGVSGLGRTEIWASTSTSIAARTAAAGRPDLGAHR